MRSKASTESTAKQPTCTSAHCGSCAQCIVPDPALPRNQLPLPPPPPPQGSQAPGGPLQQAQTLHGQMSAPRNHPRLAAQLHAGFLAQTSCALASLRPGQTTNLCGCGRHAPAAEWRARIPSLAMALMHSMWPHPGVWITLLKSTCGSPSSTAKQRLEPLEHVHSHGARTCTY
jgi:hypothetical protein